MPPYIDCDECGEETFYPAPDAKIIEVPDSRLQQKLYALKEKIYIKMFGVYDQMNKIYEEQQDTTERANQLINLTNQINVLKYVIGEI
jgi:hypothetical protein